MNLVRVKFIQTYTVQAVNGDTYQKDSVHSLPEETAKHFIKRGRAVLHTESASDPIKEIELSPKPPVPQMEERELTTTVNLLSAFNRARIKDGIEKEPVPEKPPEPEPIKLEFGDNPLVSCVMPTCNRREYIKAAIDCWLKQTYQNKELVILDDGTDSVKGIIPKKKGIRYYRVDKKEITGAKRNHVNELAKGEIICHWDDDDWSAPDRIEHQLGLLRSTGKPITGYGTLTFWDQNEEKAKRYRASVAGYVCGTSLFYLKSYWLEHPFKPLQEGSDNSFVYPALKHIASSHDSIHMVARLHKNHTSSKSGIREEIDKALIPSAFWENEKLIGRANHER